jgi:PIN domain nuclease of toxin-antitoxin system
VAVVLDASAIVAFLRDEEGADRVEEQLDRAASDAMPGVLCIVNLTEILEVLPDALTSPLFGPNGLVEVVGITQEQARWAASIKDATRVAGLSLANRLCLAVAHETKQSVVTADRAWSEVDVGVSVVQIRGRA